MTLTPFQKLIQQHRTLWMGILNITPDSFSDGGHYLSEQSALNRAETLVAKGAHILDIGAVSTRPGSREVAPIEEWKRLEPVLTKVRERLPEAWISLDSSSPQIVEKAFRAGLVDMVNDVYAGQKQDAGQSTFTVAARYNAPIILMHMQKTPQTMQENPEYQDCVEEVCQFLQERVSAAREHGVVDVLVDPGIGFGKTLKNNYELLSQQGLRRLARVAPVLIGLSRKSFLVSQLPENHPGSTNPSSRDKLTKDWEIHCISQGVSVIRTHKLPNEV